LSEKIEEGNPMLMEDDANDKNKNDEEENVEEESDDSEE